MKKISVEKSDSLILKYVIKVIVSTIACVGVFSLLFAQMMLKFDLNLDLTNAVSIVVCALSAIIISCVSVAGLKNNGLIMGIISVVPLLFYSLFNLVFYDNNLVCFAVKAVLVLLLAAFFGLLITRKSRKFKV